MFMNVAVPPVRLTVSPLTWPVSDRVAIVADTVPSYTLWLAVKLPAIDLAVMSAVSVETELRM